MLVDGVGEAIICNFSSKQSLAENHHSVHCRDDFSLAKMSRIVYIYHLRFEREGIEEQ